MYLLERKEKLTAREEQLYFLQGFDPPSERWALVGKFRGAVYAEDSRAWLQDRHPGELYRVRKVDDALGARVSPAPAP